VSRTAVYQALVLRNRPSGESNSEVTLLTAEEGIITATVFGGPKSKLRAHSAPFNSGQVWIYRDKIKNYAHNQSYAKLSDFDVHSWRAGLREQYDRTMAASAAAQTILSTHGSGGDWALALKLATDTLDMMENAGEELCSNLLVHFLWRWTNILGIQPHLDCCSDCGQKSDTALWFNNHEGSLLCKNCMSAIYSDNAHHLLQLNPGCRRWFSAAGQLDPSLIPRYSMDKKSFNEAKALVTAILTEALGKRLDSWDW